MIVYRYIDIQIIYSVNQILNTFPSFFLIAIEQQFPVDKSLFGSQKETIQISSSVSKKTDCGLNPSAVELFRILLNITSATCTAAFSFGMADP